MAGTETTIKIFHDLSRFRDHIDTCRQPAILKGYDLGRCLEQWRNPAYFMDKVGDCKEAKVHVVAKDEVDRMDFLAKNFNYVSMNLKQLVSSIFIDSDDANDDKYYLRSLGDDPRGQIKADFNSDFPALASDFKFDPSDFFEAGRFFSSVLRLSSSGVRVWTHYDIMDNVYAQIVGRKTAILWPPNEALNLYLDGDKSRVVDLADPHLDVKYPKLKLASKYLADLDPGDILFIPALWFHNMKAIDAGIAINVFWKNLQDDSFYDKKDPYGNKDVVPGAKALRMLDNVWHQLDDLPEEFRDFYGRKLIARLEAKCLSKKDITE